MIRAHFEQQIPIMLPYSRILVTGGASFIGSHLVERLMADGYPLVRVVDDLSTGLKTNIEEHLLKPELEFIEADLREPGVARQVVDGIDLVFHLAADHGGRGYIDTHQSATGFNLMLDGTLFREAAKAGVQKIVYASSGCVYPESLQADPGEMLYLSEDLVKPPYEADNLYGWAKLMAELQLQALHRETGLKTASCRYFTAYGPRCLESHAVMAMIGRAMVKQSPFEVWGDGTQIRNWTYVDDVVEGTLRVAERIDDGTAVNIGTTERTSVLQAARLIMKMIGCNSEIKTLPHMPTGPLNRVADDRLSAELLGWRPKTQFADGVRKSIDWYYRNRDEKQASAALNRLLDR